MPKKTTGDEPEKKKKRRRTSVTVGHKMVEKDGKKVRVPIRVYPSGKSKAALQERVKEARRVHGLGGPGTDADISVAEYARRWLKNKKPDISHSTYLSYRACIEKQIIPSIGKRLVVSVNASTAKSCLADCANLSIGTRNKVAYLLKAIFREATIDGIAIRDPTTTIKQKTDNTPIRRALTDEESAALLKCASSRSDGLLVTLLYYTGLRPGEALGLQWKHINLEKKELRVDQQLHKTKDGMRVDRNLKTENSRRRVPLPDELVEALKRVRGMPDVYLFHTRTGRYYTETKMREQWKNLMTAAKVEGVTPRFLRHNYATVLYLAGVREKEAAKILGHTVSVMMEIYVNIEDELRDIDISTINTAFVNKVANLLPRVSHETPG
jgi:integrase